MYGDLRNEVAPAGRTGFLTHILKFEWSIDEKEM